jgi:Co/Zn/Cd efflux system component
MDDCCNKKEGEIIALKTSHAKLLWAVLAINAVMFAVEIIFGILSRSTALKADSLDMLGDSLVYAMTLMVLHKSVQQQARVSLLKGVIMLFFGVGVVIDAIIRFSVQTIPVAQTMGWVGLMALTMNTVCFVLLWRHRSDNLNMSSTWMCSRNDLIANTGVLIAAGLTAISVKVARLDRWHFDCFDFSQVGNNSFEAFIY